MIAPVRRGRGRLTAVRGRSFAGEGLKRRASPRQVSEGLQSENLPAKYSERVKNWEWEAAVQVNR